MIFDFLLAGVPLSERLITSSSESTSWAWSAQPTIELVPRQQYTGPDGTTRRIGARLHWMLGVEPNDAIALLKSLGDLGQAAALQRPDGELLGYYVLASLDVTEVWRVGERLLAADVNLSLSPDREPGPTTPRGEAVEGSIKGVATMPARPDVNRDPSSVSLAEIVRAPA